MQDRELLPTVSGAASSTRRARGEPKFTLSKTDRVVKCAIFTLGAITCLIATSWTLWTRYDASQEVFGATEHSLHLQEFMQNLASLKLYLEFGFLVEASTSLVAHTAEFAHAEHAAERDLVQTLNGKVRSRISTMQGSLEALKAQPALSPAAAIQQALGGPDGNGVEGDVRITVQEFETRIEEIKASTLHRTEQALWDTIAMWDGAQERLLAMLQRIKEQALDSQELQQIAVAKAGKKPGLGRYVTNFFSNLDSFSEQYGERQQLSPATKLKLLRLRGMLAGESSTVQQNTTELHIPDVDLAGVEQQVQEVLAQTPSFPPYNAERFDHQLEGYLNDIIFVDHMSRLSESSLHALKYKHTQYSQGDFASYFMVCMDVLKLVGLRKVPMRWLVDPSAASGKRWPSIDHFDID